MDTRETQQKQQKQNNPPTKQTAPEERENEVSLDRAGKGVAVSFGYNMHNDIDAITEQLALSARGRINVLR